MADRLRSWTCIPPFRLVVLRGTRVRSDRRSPDLRNRLWLVILETETPARIVLARARTRDLALLQARAVMDVLFDRLAGQTEGES